ncbi:hypothetical protein [Pelobacter propionicus]|uniref:Porin domain-containing protein n=1 Tax=Pelobacter propionicus (strain DSM 2379 / NBRC 103807 / OttBd1) TaxID=338966 RepID=A1AMF2_PELPD|nr:hypothetical protein [Pelobacter propionicus]ABK98522.1 conserved hypothetical protein [Pelobacter propionicus DSM 2379]
MKKRTTLALGLCMAASLTATNPASAAFTVGGENGWQLSTDGIVDVFATYHTTTRIKSADATNRGIAWLDNNTFDETNQRFGIGVGLLPSVVAFNIKAPTTNGIDSTVRVGIYPSIQNGNQGGPSNRRFSVGGNIDFREMFYTAKGKYGEFLAGRALNLYQGKNILTDMTLLTAGTVGARDNTVTLGHIGFGYLYTGFGPQMRYTTPEFLPGTKFAIAIGEPYNISSEGGDKTNLPRVEAELSYAQTYKSGAKAQAWLSGIYQRSTRKTSDNVTAATLNLDGTTTPGSSVPNPRAGDHLESIGGAYGIGGGYKGVELLFSGYGGRGLGMVSAQDGTLGSTDSAGQARLFWGFLAQATYQINPTWKVGINYGQSRLEETDQDTIDRNNGTYAAAKKQESGVFSVTYNLNSFTQFVAEYILARQTWHDGAHQTSNQFAFGTMFYW